MQLYHRPLDQAQFMPLVGTEGATNPFFAPNGDWVGYKRGRTLRRVPLAGGPSVTIGQMPDIGERRGVFSRSTWGLDDTVWTGSGFTGLYQVPAGGGEPQLTTVPGEANEGVQGHDDPWPLPNGRGILYTAFRALEAEEVALYVPNTGEHRLLTVGVEPWFAATGHVMFRREDALWAMPFDEETLEQTGVPVLVREGIRTTARTSMGWDGTLVFVPELGSPELRQLVWADREGNTEPILAELGPSRNVRLSPDGTTLAVERDGDILIVDVERGTASRLTTDMARDTRPVWAPDATRIVFSSDRDAIRAGHFGLYSAPVGGAGSVETLLLDPVRSFIPSTWSPDGQVLTMTDIGATGSGANVSMNVSMLSMAEGAEWQPLIETEYTEVAPEVSPSGRFLAFSSDESGDVQVHLATYPDTSIGRWQVSRDGGYIPFWSPDEGEIFFTSPGGTGLMRAGIQTEPEVVVSEPTRLFGGGFFLPYAGRHSDISPDGQRFLMVADPSSEPARELVVVRRWIEDLERLVPTN